jgi:HK97 family phage major capsid protein
MKHRFLYDSGANEGAGGVLVKTIADNFTKTSAQIEAVKSEHQKAITDLEAKHKAAIDQLTKANDEEISKVSTLVKQLEKDLEDQKKKANEFAQAQIQSKSTEAEFEEKLTAQKEQLGQKRLFSVDLSTKAFGMKAVGNMGSATNLTGSYFVTPDVKPGVVVRPFEQLHMRDLLPIGRTASNVVRHLRDNGGEGGPATVAEGGTKPQMDRDLSIEDASVRKIATYLRVPEEMIEDIPYLTSFITNVGTEEVMAVEDAQIIYGDGTGQNLDGLFTNKTAFAAGTVVIGASSNRFDVLRAARMQMRKAKRAPSFALVSPLDYFVMTSAKDTTNNYILQGGGNGLVPALDGVPIIEMNQMTDGDFLLVDRRAAEIDFRTNVQVRFYEQDQDNAIKNMVTIVIEERLALPIYYTDGLVGGTFTAAITDLTS